MQYTLLEVCISVASIYTNAFSMCC